MKKHSMVILVALMILLGSVRTSQSALTVSKDPGGAVLLDPGNGFPVWYGDGTVSLIPCLTENPVNFTLNPFCVVLPDPFFDAITPPVFPANFPTEFFFWIADADARGGLAPNVKVARFAIEGSFANLPTQPVTGLQTVFQRVRFTFTAPQTGHYTITHPFDSVTLEATVPGQLIKYTLDIPVGIPMDFTTMTTGPITQLLQWDTGLPIVDAMGYEYIGNPLIAHTVTAGPNGNFVQIDGPDIGGAGINTVSTNLFFVAGKKFSGVLPSALTVERAAYSRTPAGQVEVDVFATADAGAAVLFRNGSLLPDVPTTTDPVNPLSARFFGRSIMPAPAVPPAFVTVTAQVPLKVPTILTKTVTDTVSATRVQYSVSCRKLVLEAASSDELLPLPVLTAAGLGNLAPATPAPVQRLVLATVGSPPAALAPPAHVTLNSSRGGAVTEQVLVLQNIPPVAGDDAATTDIFTPIAVNVLANDTDPDGALNPASVTIVTPPVNGTAVAFPDGTVHYTPSLTFIGSETFTYTVSDIPCAPSALVTTSNVATVTVTVGAYPLIVTKTGPGTVSSLPAGIDCGGQCNANFPPGQFVTLTAGADLDAVLLTWTGDCSGAGACSVTMTAPRNIGANFDACGNPTVRVAPDFYTSVSEAYTNVPATEVYDLRRGALVSYSVPSFGQAKTVTLRGGFDCGYAVRAGTSTITGPLEIAGGLIIADGIAVR